MTTTNKPSPLMRLNQLKDSPASVQRLNSTALLLMLSVIGAGLLPNIAEAAANQPPTIEIKPVVGFTNLSQAINTLFTALLFFGALMTFVFIVLGAVRYVTAGDDASAVKQARATITNAVIGLIILGLIFVIFRFVLKLVPGLSGIFA